MKMKAGVYEKYGPPAEVLQPKADLKKVTDGDIIRQ
jgi:hypothetical protein